MKRYNPVDLCRAIERETGKIGSAFFDFHSMRLPEKTIRVLQASAGRIRAEAARLQAELDMCMAEAECLRRGGGVEA